MHKSELEWQRVKLERQAEQELAALRARHDQDSSELRRTMTDLGCARADS